MFLNSHTLASLRFFAAAARVSSFKQAAMDLHVTQGAVSQQIKQLDEALGVRLFYRLVRQVSLTEEGQQFAAVVARSLEDIERSASSISAPKSTAEIRLRAGPSFSLRWLVPRLADFYSRHKGIRLFLNAAYGAFDPARREFDLAIEQTKEKLPSLHCEVLMDEFLTPVCSPEFLKRHAFLKKPKDLERCTLLHDGHPWPGAAEDAEWRHWLDEAGAPQVDSRQGQFFSLANLAIEAALTHQGVAMGRASLFADLLEARRLVAPFPQRVKSPTRYYLVYHKDLVGRADIQAVIQWLREQTQRPT